MKDKFCEAIEDMECILLSTFNEYSSINEDSKFLTSSIDSYYKDNDIFKRPSIPKERVLEDRKKIIDILSLFYKENRDKEDDFVTLFAIYCNNYIRYNFHQILSDEDFGISEFFDVIGDKDLQEYLKVIQQVIYKQDISYFEKANVDINKYSVVNIYLFIFSIRDYSINKYRKEINFKKQKDIILSLSHCFDEKPIYSYSEQENGNINSPKLLDYFDNISDKLQHYLLGEDNLFECCYYKYPLPYLKVVNNDTEFQDFIVQYFSDYCKKMKSFSKNSLDSDEKIYKNLHSSVDNVIRKIEDFDIRDENIRKLYINSDVIEDRKLYLGIPSVVFNSEYYISLILEQNRLNKEKEGVIRDFTHKYGNMKATTLNDVAKILLRSDNEEYRKQGRKVLFEYANKESLTKDIQMTKLMYNNNIAELYEMLRSSLLDTKDPSKKDINDVIDTSLIFCLINVFYNKKGDFKNMRVNLESFIKNFDDFKETFQTEVIFREENCVEWLRNRGINFILNGLENWNLIALNSEDYAFVYLKDIFQELFLNYFRHGSVEKPILVNLSSTKDRFIISVENYLCDNTYEKNIGFVSTATGLISFANILPKLYEEKIPVEECFRVIHKKDIFRVEIEIPKKRFVLE